MALIVFFLPIALIFITSLTQYAVILVFSYPWNAQPASEPLTLTWNSLVMDLHMANFSLLLTPKAQSLNQFKLPLTPDTLNPTILFYCLHRAYHILELYLLIFFLIHFFPLYHKLCDSEKHTLSFISSVHNIPRI